MDQGTLKPAILEIFVVAGVAVEVLAILLILMIIIILPEILCQGRGQFITTCIKIVAIYI